jgi:hypothetical protein
VEGLEEDEEWIFEYMRNDFVFTQKRKSPVPYGYSTGDSLQSTVLTTRTNKVFLERETGFENCLINQLNSINLNNINKLL